MTKTENLPLPIPIPIPINVVYGSKSLRISVGN